MRLDVAAARARFSALQRDLVFYNTAEEVDRLLAELERLKKL